MPERTSIGTFAKHNELWGDENGNCIYFGTFTSQSYFEFPFETIIIR